MGDEVTKGKRQYFSPNEDMLLRTLVTQVGPDWDLIAKQMKGRNARQCRDRWCCYLNPQINKSSWTNEEDQLLLQSVSIYGSNWKKLTHFFNRRTDGMLKNRYLKLQRHIKRDNKLSCNLLPQSSSVWTSDIPESPIQFGEDLVDFYTEFDDDIWATKP